MRRIDWKHLGNGLLHWSWVPAVLYWIVRSAGIFSELAFLVASVWKSVNASDHDFVLMFVSELQSIQTTYWANSAYIVLSVCILPLAAMTTYGHVKTWLYGKKWWCASAIWTLLYGCPTIVFLVIDIAIISSPNVTYVLPDYLVSARSIMAYLYGLTAILYHYAGKDQETDRLKAKDVLVGELRASVQILASQIDTLSTEIENQKRLLVESKKAQILLQNEVKRGTDDALQAYGDDCVKWLYSGIKTATIDDIIRLTGHSKQKVVKAKLRRSPRNADLILIESLTEWLKETAPSAPQLLRIVPG
jgi:hypothetical protein